MHDYLNQRGGAERVVVEFARMWPRAPIYTSLYRPGSTFPELARHEVRTSPLQRLPIDAGFRALAPLYPAAFRALGVLGQDLVVSSSSGWAHGVRTARASVHVVYCHAPARWLYTPSRYLAARSPRQRLLSLANPYLRRWDQAAAHAATGYVVNAENVRARVRDVYGIDSQVVHPPVDVERFTPTPRGERLLVVSRLLPYKRVDLAVAAATRSGRGLDVVGSGPMLDELRRAAGASVTFHGTVSDAALTELIQACSALCVPGGEDFGIALIEANAAGKPVVAFAQGGALETVRDGVTGTLFAQPTVEALLDAIARADGLQTASAEIRAHAERYSRAAFQSNFLASVERIRAARGAV